VAAAFQRNANERLLRVAETSPRYGAEKPPKPSPSRKK
jgi:hypothetical protein